MRKICGLLVIALVLSSCAHTVVFDAKPRNTPPGEVKKVTGSQSARPYAPLQQNRKN